MPNQPVTNDKDAQKDQPINQAARPEDVPDDQLEEVAAGHGHDRWYHHHGHEGRRGYYRNGVFIELGI